MRLHRHPLRAVLVAAVTVASGLLVVASPTSAQVGSARVSPAPAVSATAGAARPARPIVLRFTYTVVAGDTLAGISRRYGVRLDDLRKLNRLKLTSMLRPGRVLRIPAIVVPATLVSRIPAAAHPAPGPAAARDPIFLAASKEFAVPADLLMAVAFRESNWNAVAVSRSGAMGIGQLMPSTVTFVSTRLLRLPRPLNPWEPVDNIRMSARTLRQLLDLTGQDPFRALRRLLPGVRVAHPARSPARRAVVRPEHPCPAAQLPGLTPRLGRARPATARPA